MDEKLLRIAGSGKAGSLRLCDLEPCEASPDSGEKIFCERQVEYSTRQSGITFVLHVHIGYTITDALCLNSLISKGKYSRL